jgi:hypothetical protein
MSRMEGPQTTPKKRSRRKTGPQARLVEPKSKRARARQFVTVATSDEIVDDKSFQRKYFQLPAPRRIDSLQDLSGYRSLPALARIPAEDYSQYLELIRQGSFAVTAMGNLGIPHQTFYRWLARGQQNSEADEAEQEPLNVYGKFYRDTKEAESLARGHVELWQMRRDPTSFLMNGPGRQTKDREGYAAGKNQVELSGPGGEAVQVETITREDKRAALAGALRVLAQTPGLLESLMQRAPVPIEQTNGKH